MKNRTILFVYISAFILLSAAVFTGCGMNESKPVFGNPLQGAFQSSKDFKTTNRIQISFPIIMAKSNILVFEPYTTISANDLVVIEDAAYTDVSFINGGETLDTYPGKYRTTIIARDNYGNKQSAAVEFTVREPAGYLNPEPEAIQRIKQDTSMPNEYKNFLLNKASAKITSNVNFEDLIYSCRNKPLKAGDTITLVDMCHAVFDYIDPHYRFCGVTYGLMNCGKKEPPILVVRYTIWSYATWTEDITITLAIHDDELVMTGITETYGRNLDAYYQDGCYFSNIFNNASGTYIDYHVIDENGLFHPIYSFVGSFSGDTVIIGRMTYTIADEKYVAFHILDEEEKSEEELQEIDDWKSKYRNDTDEYTIEEISDIAVSYAKSLGLPDYYSYHTTRECMLHAHMSTIYNDMLGSYIPSHTSDEEIQWQDLIILEEKYYR